MRLDKRLFFVCISFFLSGSNFAAPLFLEDCIVFHKASEDLKFVNSYDYFENHFIVEQIFDSTQRLLVYKPQGEINYLFDSEKTNGLKRIHISSKPYKNLKGKVGFKVIVVGKSQENKMANVVQTIVQMGYSVFSNYEPDEYMFQLVGGVNRKYASDSVTHFKKAVYKLFSELSIAFKIDSETVAHIFKVLSLNDLSQEKSYSECIIL